MLGLQVALRKMEQQPVHIAAQIAQEAISLQRLRAEAACSAAARDSGRLCNAAQHSMASSQPAAAKVSTKDPPPKTPKFTTKSLCCRCVSCSPIWWSQQPAACPLSGTSVFDVLVMCILDSVVLCCRLSQPSRRLGPAPLGWAHSSFRGQSKNMSAWGQPTHLQQTLACPGPGSCHVRTELLHICSGCCSPYCAQHCALVQHLLSCTAKHADVPSTPPLTHAPATLQTLLLSLASSTAHSVTFFVMCLCADPSLGSVSGLPQQDAIIPMET